MRRLFRPQETSRVASFNFKQVTGCGQKFFFRVCFQVLETKIRIGKAGVANFLFFQTETGWVSFQKSLKPTAKPCQNAKYNRDIYRSELFPHSKLQWTFSCGCPYLPWKILANLNRDVTFRLKFKPTTSELLLKDPRTCSSLRITKNSQHEQVWAPFTKRGLSQGTWKSASDWAF